MFFIIVVVNICLYEDIEKVFLGDLCNLLFFVLDVICGIFVEFLCLDVM